MVSIIRLMRGIYSNHFICFVMINILNLLSQELVNMKISTQLTGSEILPVIVCGIATLSKNGKTRYSI